MQNSIMRIIIGLLLMSAALFASDTDGTDWQSAARERIAQHRQGDLQITVTDDDGQPLPDATLHLQMTRHAFTFGTAVRADRLAQETAHSPYRHRLLENFNTAVLGNGLKWGRWEKVHHREETDAAIDWLLGQGLAVRGHTMVWGTDNWGVPTPKDLKEAYQAADAAGRERVRQRQFDHIRTIGQHYRRTIREWDVLNEQVSEHGFTDLLNPEADFRQAPVMAEWFRQADEATDGARLFINDFHVLVGQFDEHRDHYHAIIEALQEQGAPLGGIGFQCHFYQRTLATPPEELLRRLDRFAGFGLPLLVTEFDTFGKGWGETTAAAEEAQADYLHDCLLASFSHPSVSGFVMWGYWDGQHWFDCAPLFRADWSPKPGLLRYRQLVFGDWWTDAEATTDTDGRAAFRAFKGEHDLTIRVGERKRTVRVVVGEQPADYVFHWR